MSPWDAAALVPVSASGREFSDWHGRVTAFGDGAMATNGALATELRARLGVPWPDAEAGYPRVSMPNAIAFDLSSLDFAKGGAWLVRRLQGRDIGRGPE
jgi:hypothetical protein